jgi:hypothetical protein
MVQIRENKQKCLTRHAVTMVLVRPRLSAGITATYFMAMYVGRKKEAAP